MDQEQSKKAVFGALAVAAVAVVVFVVMSGAVGTQVPAKYEGVPAGAQGGGYEIVSEKTVTWNGSAVRFVHSCLRSSDQKGRDALVQFCLGENQLMAIDAAGTMRILKEETAATARAAPILLEASLVPGTKNGDILVSYAPETCATIGDCGDGAPDNYVTGAYRASDASYRELANFPALGAPVWNAAGTKALFVQRTCGPTGCGRAPILGYALASDTAKGVTTEFAVGLAEDDDRAVDPTGAPLPKWVSVAWKTDADFVATYVSEKGAKKEILGTF